MTPGKVPGNEFSRMVDRAGLPETGLELEVEATEAECAEVAKRLGLVALKGLEARLEVKPWRREGMSVLGAWRAEVVQTCIVSLDDFPAELSEDISARYAEPDDPVLLGKTDEDGEILVDPDGEDEPEVLENGCADLGELIVENLALALDPYPHKPGVEFEDIISYGEDDGGEPEGGKPNPFAVLKTLKLQDKTD